MSISTRLKTFFLNIKDLLQAIISFAMSRSEWLFSFNASPASLIVKPALALILLILIFFQAYELYLAAQIEVLKLLHFIMNLISTVLANASLFGGFAAAILHTSFTAGPWLFLAAVIVGLVHQIGMLSFTLYKTYEANDTATRMHHLQAAINQGFNCLMLASTIIVVALTIASPAAPIVLSTFAMIGVGFLVATIVWRTMSDASKQEIKQFLGIAKPEVSDSNLAAKRFDLISRKEPLPLIKPAARAQGNSLSFWSAATVEVKEENRALNPKLSPP